MPGARAAGTALASLAVMLLLVPRAEGQAVPPGSVDPPRVTLLFQNFPNPFPTVDSETTCVWFDLAEPSVVRLEVYDLRGRMVRVLLTGADAYFPAGRHGRSANSAGCDPAFSWDGRAGDGSMVPPGVYLLRLRAAGVEAVRRILFLGR